MSNQVKPLILTLQQQIQKLSKSVIMTASLQIRLVYKYVTQQISIVAAQ